VWQQLLHHEPVTAANATPAAWLYFLHGIYGAGRNWTTVARRVAGERPEWGAVLVDLREHGSSTGFEPPHTLAAAAEDVARLARGTGRPASAVLGHSFGGKVALQYASEPRPELRQVWVVDSSPDASEPRGSAWSMLGILRDSPAVYASRDAAIEHLAGAGVERPTAQWMATNLKRTDAGLRWRFDLASVEELLEDFFRSDLGAVIETGPPGVEFHVIRATESSVLTDAAMTRVRSARRAHLHVVEGGHWLNADNPDALVSLLARSLPDPAG
jgi:pimeloyl-ACP methyl ester carboxylesterase